MKSFSLFVVFIFMFISLSKSESVSLKNSSDPDSFHQSSLISELRKYKGHDFMSHNSSFWDLGSAEFIAKSLVPIYVQDLIKNEEVQKVFSKSATTLPESINKVCTSHISTLFHEIKNVLENPPLILNASTWALQMIDSWGKLPEGILSGHVNSYGDWDECVNVRAEENLEDLPNFQGQYCWTYFVPPEMTEASTNSISSRKAVSIPELIENIANPTAAALIPSTSVCLPSSCSMEEVQSTFLFLLQNLSSSSNPLSPLVYFCNTNDKPPLSTGAVSMIVVLSILGFLIMTGTGIDSVLLLKQDFSRLRKSLPIKLLLSFSLVTNVRKWQNTSSDGGFGCIHGIRFLSTCWVLLCHTLVIVSVQPPSWNLVEFNHIYEKSWPIYFILNGFFSVDTFFTMSGLLACFSILRALEKTNGKLNILKLYLHRYLRLTPTYVLLIGVLATLFPYLGDGPYFQNYAGPTAKNCQDFWWHNILYFNNLYKYNATAGEEMCDGESWYIANDMQFFILSPLFAYLIWKWQYIGMGVLSAASIASILAPGIKVGTEKLLPTFIVYAVTDGDRAIYRKPWNRIGPYFVGMWMGYIFFKIGKKRVVLPKLVVIGGWILSTATALTLILGVIPFYYPDHKGDPVGAGFYAGLSRFCWGIVICWIIFACVKGYGGWVNSFLSMKVFIPLGRLTFCVYISSFPVQTLLQTTMRQPMVFNMYTLTNMFFSHVIMCFLVGFFLTMIFESPFIALEKIIMGGGGRSKDQTKTVHIDQGDVSHNGNEKVTIELPPVLAKDNNNSSNLN